MTRLKLAGMFLLTTGIVTTGAGVFARQAGSPVQSSRSERVDKKSQAKPASQPQAPDDGARDEVELAKARRDIRETELRAADARYETAKTKQLQVQSLYQRKITSKQKLDEANAELRDREAERNVALAGLREAELQLRQAERRRDQDGRKTAKPGPEENNEVKLAKIRRNIKDAALRAATARLGVAQAELDRLTLLDKRGAGFVSRPEIAKAHAEVKDREAQRDIAQAELQEAELFVADAERLAALPGSQPRQPLRANAVDSAALERRLNELDSKLDRIIKALEGRDQAR